MKPGGLLQPLSIPDWKWDDISMYFIVSLPLTTHKFNLIWVIMDRLTKSAHFIPIYTRYRVEKYAEIYIAHVLYLHGVPKTIVSDRGSQLVACFWEQLHASLGTCLIHSSAYHSQMDGQIESQPNSRRYAQSLCDRIRVVGTRICPGLNFHTTTSTKKVLKWYHSRHYMDNNAAHHSIGSSQERKLYFVQTLLMRPKQRYAVLKTT
jgi:hypothetical protein